MVSGSGQRDLKALSGERGMSIDLSTSHSRSLLAILGSAFLAAHQCGHCRGLRRTQANGEIDSRWQGQAEMGCQTLLRNAIAWLRDETFSFRSISLM